MLQQEIRGQVAMDDIKLSFMVSTVAPMRFGIDLGSLLAHLRIPPEFDDVNMAVDARKGCRVEMMVDDFTANRLWAAYGREPTQYFCGGVAHDIVAVAAHKFGENISRTLGHLSSAERLDAEVPHGGVDDGLGKT